MRNRIFVIILVVIINNNVKSQPTLIAGNSNPHITLQYTYIGIDYIAPTDPQGFFSWDFSSIVARDTFTTRYYGHGGVPGDDLFPLSNIARKIKNSYEFYLTSEQGVSVVGYKDSLNYIYSDGAEIIRYPFTYLDNDSDYYTCHYYRNDDSIRREGLVINFAKSYGNLKLPYAIINNVLGIKRSESFNDFTKGGNEYHVIESYTWHVPGVSLPILSFSSENFNGKITESGYYISKESLGVNYRTNLPFDLTLLHNDRSKVPDMQIILPYQLTLTIRCVNSIGKEMFVPIYRKLAAGQNKVELPDQNILAGMYLMIITIDDYQVAKRFIVTQ